MNKEIIELIKALDEVEEFKPLIKKSIDALRELSPDVKKMLDDIAIYAVSRRANQIEYLVTEHYFTRDEAITITLDVNSSMADSLRHMSKHNKPSE